MITGLMITGPNIRRHETKTTNTLHLSTRSAKEISERGDMHSLTSIASIIAIGERV